ncbi:MAG TPA: PfkB family carbohydrate kinase, partial [Mycobacterium sp.]
ANEVGARCILNPAPPIDEVIEALAYQPILTPNAGECRDLAARIGVSSSDTRSAAMELCQYSKAPVIVTMGGEGLMVCEPGMPPVHVQALDVDVVDTTGAGDTFNGVFAARLSDGDTIDVAATVANRAAAISVGTVGARAGMPRSTDLAG